MASQTISNEQRRQMIADAAYFRAERRGFNGSAPLLDWVEAEAEIDARLRQQEHEALLTSLEERLTTVGKKVQSLRKKLSGLGTNARAEWQQDIETLGQLRNAFEKRLTEIREQGQSASQKVKEQAEKIWDEISQVVQRASSRGKTRRREGARSRSRSSLEERS
jgi:DNA anti-recombination protein RmuC